MNLGKSSKGRICEVSTMKIKVLNKSEKELRIEIVGESHTFCNILQHTLLKDKHIDYAGYRIPHPLISNPIFYIRTKESKSPEDALMEAVKMVNKEAKKIREAFEEALKEI
jgi:DNA-directed RNA polymerase subunit L